MRVVRDFVDLPADQRGGVVALGNFDGVHRGHREIIATTARTARRLDAPLGVLTFEPHPRNVFAPEAPPFRLTPFRSKARLLSALGVDLMYTLRFNERLYTKPAEDFVRDVLIGGLDVQGIVVGYDFVFGHRRSGDADLLVRLGQDFGFEVSVLAPVTHDEDVCSSTIIRVNLETGRAKRAAELLGHWWEVESHVRRGDQRGRQLGFPTANVFLGRRSLQPALGVYAVHFGLPDNGKTTWFPAVANLGYRPTFGGDSVVLEAHLFDFDGDLYGREVRVAFVEHLRAEKKFDGLDALKAQIAADSARARELLALPENAVDRFAATVALANQRGAGS